MRPVWVNQGVDRVCYEREVLWEGGLRECERKGLKVCGRGRVSWREECIYRSVLESGSVQSQGCVSRGVC